MSRRFKIMFVGMGDLAGWALEFLARTHGPFEIVTADYNEDLGLRRTNSAILSSFQQGMNHKIEFVRVDLNDVEHTAEVLRNYQPDLVYNSSTLQSWWVVAELPKEAYDKIDVAQFGPWLPMHLLLIHRLMKAVKMAGINPIVVNAAFPDVTNPVLAKVGLAPTVGIGNIDNLVPALTYLAAEDLHLHPMHVKVYLVAPHFVSFHIARYGNAGGAPFGMRILADGRDVTSECDVDSLLRRLPTRYKRPGGRGAHPLVAASVVKNIVGIMNDTGELGHSPGPNGLPGGYPIILSAEGVEVAVPPGMTLEGCIDLNNEAQKWDGIERIDNDGSTVFTDYSHGIFKEVLGYDCKVLKIDECEGRVAELQSKFGAFLRKHGINAGH